MTLNPFSYQEDESVLGENGRGDLGWSKASKLYQLYNAGSTCVLKCNKGYKLVGDISITCDRTGHWVGEPANCIRKLRKFILYPYDRA